MAWSRKKMRTSRQKMSGYGAFPQSPVKAARSGASAAESYNAARRTTRYKRGMIAGEGVPSQPYNVKRTFRTRSVGQDPWSRQSYPGADQPKVKMRKNKPSKRRSGNVR